MIGVVFQFASETIEARVDGSKVYFRNSSGNNWATIDELKLDYKGVIKEHPDLEGVENWRKIAAERFKQKIINMENEEQRVAYLIEDLTKFGYKAYAIQRQGFRPVKL